MWLPSNLLNPVKAASNDSKPIHCDLSSVEFIEAAGGDGDKPGPKKFSLVGYTGGQMRVDAFYRPVVIDLAGLKAAGGQIPALLGHDPDKIVGHGEPEISSQRVKLSGVLSGGGPAAEEVRLAAANGFPWKASVGVFPDKVEYVEAGSKATANGKTWQGPINIVRGGTLYEISFVPIAADSKTSVSVAAKRPEGVSDMSDENILNLEAMRRNAVVEIEQAEKNRIEAIKATCGAGHADILAKAIESGWDSDRTELEVLRASRSKPPTTVYSAPVQASQAKAIEAAFAATAGVDVERHYKPDVLEASDRYRGIGLQEVMLMGARSNGYSSERGRITNGNIREILAYALPPITAGVGFSTLSVSSVLSNLANKSLLDGFMAVEQTWKAIAKIGNVSDFKEATRHRLTDSLEYEEVGAAGEIAHGTLGEETYTLTASTYAKMLGLTRQDIINDDMGAFDTLRERLGRGAGLKLNKVFWTAFLDDATFFTEARGNLIGTALATSGAALNTASQAFMELVDNDGNPLGIRPSILLVPPALAATAKILHVSTEIRNTASDTEYSVANVHYDMYRPEVSAYLNTTAVSGGSATAWYLVADPKDLAVAEVAFLGGQQAPTVESAEADFNLLGVQFRGFHDFAVALAEWRAAVKSTGTE